MGSKQYHRSWDETSFRAKVQQLVVSHKKNGASIQTLDNLKLQAGGYSALSSDYYSVMGTAWAHVQTAKRKPWRWPMATLWGGLGFYCLLHVRNYSDRMVACMGRDNLTADQCDIRQSILRQLSTKPVFGRKNSDLEEALWLIAHGLKQEASLHTRGLLLGARAEIYSRPLYLSSSYRRGQVVTTCREAAEIATVCETSEPRQAVRIFKLCSQVASRIPELKGDSFTWHAAAMRIQAAVGAQDQRLKLGVQC